ncbi:hypothetical protein TrRE_jg7975, partial [Triparma retinervis]
MFALEGAAGTGKTTIIQALLSNIDASVALTPSNVQASFYGRKGLTIHSAFGMTPFNQHHDNQRYKALNGKQLILFDETQQAEKANWKTVIGYLLALKPTVIVFVLDNAQTPFTQTNESLQTFLFNTVCSLLQDPTSGFDDDVDFRSRFLTRQRRAVNPANIALGDAFLSLRPRFLEQALSKIPGASDLHLEGKESKHLVVSNVQVKIVAGDLVKERTGVAPVQVENAVLDGKDEYTFVGFVTKQEVVGGGPHWQLDQGNRIALKLTRDKDRTMMLIAAVGGGNHKYDKLASLLENQGKGIVFYTVHTS